MSDHNVLPFQPPDEHDANIARRVAALYAHTPAPTEQQVARCVRAVREDGATETRFTAMSRPGGRWMVGLAAAAILVVATLRPWSNGSTSTHDSATDSAVAANTAAATTGSVTSLGSDAVRFDIHLPDTANAVAIVGDFNGWNQAATPMAQRGKGGTWSAKVPLLPGRHVYAFVVDGKKWVVDPMAPQVPDDGYGPANAVVIEPSSK